MTSRCFRAFIVGIAFSVCLHATAEAEAVRLTVVAEIYQTKRATAAPFMQASQIDPDRFVAELRKRSEAFNSDTKIVKLPAITATSGARSAVDAGDIDLQVQPVVSPNGEFVTLNAVLAIGKEKRLTTSGTVRFGGTLFLGSIDGGPDDLVQLAFISALRHP